MPQTPANIWELKAEDRRFWKDENYGEYLWLAQILEV